VLVKVVTQPPVLLLPSSLFSSGMPKIRRSNKPPPEGWELIEPTLKEIDLKVRDGTAFPNSLCNRHLDLPTQRPSLSLCLSVEPGYPPPPSAIVILLESLCVCVCGS